MNTVIRLKESADPKGFKAEDLIHQEEFDRALNLIREVLAKASPKEDDVASFKSYDAITVLGTRGSGKTSFINSLQKNCQEDDKLELEVLTLIDPTLIENKGHVFLNVVSIIKEVVDQKLDRESFEPVSKTALTKKKWVELIAKLANGLPSIDGIGGELNEPSWQDPEYIMDRGIESVTTARKLSYHFRNIVRQGLGVLGKKAFLLCFDDVDIEFSKGWQVLECIRKYFTFPELIVVVSGDLQLFSKLIRKRNWENFGTRLLSVEAMEMNKLPVYNMMVTEMEEQYLSKVLKPESRLHLVTLREQVERKKRDKKRFSIRKQDEYGIYIQYKDGKEEEIGKLYERILKSFGINSSSDLEVYRSYLLSLPLRTQIRLFNAFFQVTSITDQKILDVFLSYLLERNVNVNLLQHISQFLNIEILLLLIREKQLKDGFLLQPIMLGNSMNACLCAFDFLLSNNIARNQPYLIFDYFIRIGFVRNALSTFGYSQITDIGLPTKPIPSIEGLIEHAGFYIDKDLRDVVGAANSYIRAFLSIEKTNLRPWGGTILTWGLAERQKQNDTVSRIDGLLEGLSVAQKNLGYIPLTVCRFPSNQETLVVYSVYSLLGVIGDLLRELSMSGTVSKLVKFSSMAYFDMPDFKKGNSVQSKRGGMEDEPNLMEDLSDIPETPNGLNTLTNAFQEWGLNSPREAISGHLLGKMAFKIHTAFENIETRTKPKNLGVAISNRVIALMNAVLIEDVLENAPALTDISINNTNASPKIFISNLEKAFLHSKSLESLSFSRWFLACPVFFAYIDNGDGNENDTDKNSAYKVLQNLQDFCDLSDDQLRVYKSFSIFETLKKLDSKGI